LSTGDRVLDVGCGTGTDSIWLAQQGYEVVGVDIAPRSIELARVRAQNFGVSNIRFVVGDILKELPFDPGNCVFAYDRGCLHAVGNDERRAFAERVFEALRPEGYWLTLCGNADEKRPEGTHGPPQLTARDIVDAVENRFEIQFLRQSRVRDAGEVPHLSWECLVRTRA